MESIPLPKSVEVLEQTGTKAILAIGPCYPGYGVTLGNALRRVLLGSLPGAAITDVKITGANHEFTSLPDVVEDAVSIILNLKSTRLRLQGDEPMTMTLKAKGEKVVKAKDFKLPSQLEVINGDQPIATLTDKNAQIEIEAIVGPGRGYVPVENREKEKHDIGQIAIDAIYTPVKTVNFRTEHVRVEQMTNYDRLILEIETDGSLTPTDAFHQAAEILTAQFGFLQTYDSEVASAGDLAEAGSADDGTEKAKDEAPVSKKKTKESKDE